MQTLQQEQQNAGSQSNAKIYDKEENNAKSMQDGKVEKTSAGCVVFGTVFNVGDNYEIVSPIGQGAYGVVVAAKVKNPIEGEETEEGKIEGEGGEGEGDDQMVAIKKIVLQNFTAGMIRRTLREIKILRLL